MIDRSQADWYKDAIIYQLHIKAFFDANNDGIGDFAGLMQKLDYLQELGVNTRLAAAVLSLAAARRRLRHRRLPQHQSVLRHAARLPHASSSGARARPARHHRAGDQPHLRPASLVPARARTPSPARRIAITTSGATPISAIRRPASSSSTPRSRTGPGTRSRSTISGTASITISRISTSTIRAVLREILRDPALLARHGGRRAAPRRHSLSDRARRHDQREPARDARRPEAHPRRDRPALPRAACCSPRPTSGPRTCCPISATATNATWRSTSR